MKKIYCKDTNETFKDYSLYLKSKHWNNKKKEFFKKNIRICSKCKSKKKIHLHHLTYKNVGNENLKDLIYLCEKCHIKEHLKIKNKKNKLYVLKQVQNKERNDKHQRIRDIHKKSKAIEKKIKNDYLKRTATPILIKRQML